MENLYCAKHYYFICPKADEDLVLDTTRMNNIRIVPRVQVQHEQQHEDDGDADDTKNTLFNCAASQQWLVMPLETCEQQSKNSAATNKDNALAVHLQQRSSDLFLHISCAKPTNAKHRASTSVMSTNDLLLSPSRVTASASLSVNMNRKNLNGSISAPVGLDEMSDDIDTILAYTRYRTCVARRHALQHWLLIPSTQYPGYAYLWSNIMKQYLHAVPSISKLGSKADVLNASGAPMTLTLRYDRSRKLSDKYAAPDSGLWRFQTAN